MMPVIQKAGDDKEDVDAGKTTRQPRRAKVKYQNCQYRDATKPVNVRAVGAPAMAHS